MVPVVVLTGFLGSGKTTLLNQLLEHGSPVSGKLAVIVNEFGSVGIDGDLLPPEMSRQVELPGGCVCCVLDDDLGKTIVELLAGDKLISLIIIETSGIAEPLPISWTLAGEPLRDIVRLASVVTTVDALEHRRHRPLCPSVDAQVIDADILAITKTDLASPQDVAALTAELREQNDHAPLLTGDLAAGLRQIVGDPSRVSDAGRGEGEGEEVATHRHASGEHGHIQSAALAVKSVLDYEELADALQALPTNYLRIKGIADLVDPGSGWDEPVRAAFHRVGARVSVERITGRQTGEPRLVAVGYELDVERLNQCLEDARVDA